MTQERARAALALDLARQGHAVSLVSSGDIGVYGLAALALEMLRDDDTVRVEIVPGITAALSSASLLGAPMALDFATLSLSDLMCPWEQIVRRARALASCGMAVALYNPQSRQRREGIYQIADIFLAHRDGNTPCGSVRNAYRPDQKVEHFSLGDIPSREFDMFTTIIIGGENTQRRREFIFAPRGYLSPAGQALPVVPERAVWIFSGTGDGNALAATVREKGFPVVVSAAGEHGAYLARTLDLPTVCGSLGQTRRAELMREKKALAIVDATHPHAQEISRQLMRIADENSIPYLRYERPAAALPANALVCQNADEAAARAIGLGQRIFLATGAKSLRSFLSAPGATEREWFARVTSDALSVEQAVAAGVPRKNILAMQGPFSTEFNSLLWREWQIDCVVTKESGNSGGFPEKITAAQQLGIPLVVIARPEVDYPVAVSDESAVVSWLTACL